MAVKDKQPWEWHRDNCMKLGGELASIKDEAEDDFLFDFIKEKLGFRTWIGLHRDGPGQPWKWMDGSLAPYFRWDLAAKGIYQSKAKLFRIKLFFKHYLVLKNPNQMHLSLNIVSSCIGVQLRTGTTTYGMLR